MRHTIFAIAILICTAAEAQVIRAEPFYTAPEAAAAPIAPLLDSFTNAHTAYSLRLLRTAYSGNAIRIRRASDNTEQNIGFALNYLDTAAIKTFCNGTNCFVTTWYDQSVNSNNASQSTAANQPQIFSSTTGLYYKGNAVAINFDGNDELIVASSTAKYNYLHNGTASSFLVVFSDYSGGNFDGFFGNNRGANANVGCAFGINEGNLSNIRLYATGGTGAAIIVYEINTANNTIGSGHFIVHCDVDGNASPASARASIYINGGSATATNTATGTSTANASFNMSIGNLATTLSANAFPGRMQELIMWDNDKSGNRTAIRDNINSFYSIY